MDSTKFSAQTFNVCPQKMTFYAPYDRHQNRLITILNPTASRQLFKLRSNCSCYYVSPKCGCIEPYDTREVTVRLHNFDFQSEQTYNHRFCVQCIQAPTDELMESQTILDLFKQTPLQRIHNVRIPIELQPHVCSVPQTELDAMLPQNNQYYLKTLRPVGFNFMQHFKQLTLQLNLPASQNRCYILRRSVMALLIIMAGFICGRNISIL
ncbi:hypothetical protein KR222_011481 [Zaprionus bogoriensis]|nr:hypothetical protein KR222_011481 [Zaprionus bogoriensis]